MKGARLGLWALASAGLGAIQASSQSTSDSLDLITKRRVIDLAQFPDPSFFKNIETWLGSQTADGTWSDVNYLSGCPAQRANWPIQQHFNRLITFAAAWTGVNPVAPSNWTNDASLLAAVKKGLDYWFTNDYTEPDCVGEGGSAGFNCPCGTPGLWNTNWYDQAILIPQLISTTCLLIKDANLTDAERKGCQTIPQRAYDLIDVGYGTGGNLTGANIVLVMQNSVSLALFLNNATILQDAYNRAMSTITFVDGVESNGVSQDGIHRDGSFLQHTGVLYNGNYGKDSLNAFIQLEGEAIGTPFAANDATRAALAAQVKGNEWMIHTEKDTGRELWDFNAIGRFVSFPVQDLQADSDINFNVTKLQAAVADFTGAINLNDTIRRLLSNGTEKLNGNMGFWASDYMSHRRNDFIIGHKMLSTRSASLEGLNSANPFGYYLGQGSTFRYVEGTEYKDIMDAWDWNLIPGTTVLLNKTGPVLTTNVSAYVGKKEFVGTVSDGKYGVAAQDYVDPYDAGLAYRKSWFFFDDVIVVTTSEVSVNKSVSAAQNKPVISVLDNRASASGGIFVDGVKYTGEGKAVPATTLVYGGAGYVALGKPFCLTVSEGKRTGNWSVISTSTLGETTVSLFSAYTEIPNGDYSYAFLPATTKQRVAEEARNPTATPISDGGITGAVTDGALGLVFWPGAKKSITLDLRKLGWAKKGTVTIKSEQPGNFLFTKKCKGSKGGIAITVAISDPTQKLTQATYSLSFNGAKVGPLSKGRVQGLRAVQSGLEFVVDLPSGGFAGSSLLRDIYVS